MKRRLLIILFVTFLVSVWSSTAISQMTTTTKLEQLYSKYIDEFISKCEFKAGFRNSKLVNIRREAALYCFKAHYLKKHKNDLIRDMIAEDIGLKRHRIHYYLNKRFFAMLRTALASMHHTRTRSGVL
jgi:hypothetical protein